MSDDEQEAAGCVIGRDYPAPIVDHKRERERAMERYRAVLAASLPAAWPSSTSSATSRRASRRCTLTGERTLPGRAGGELLVPAPPRRLRVDRRARRTAAGSSTSRAARATAAPCSARTARVGRRRRRQPGGVRARAAEVHGASVALRARHGRAWTGDVDCVVFLQTIEHVQDPDAVLDRIRDADRAGRRRLRLDAERAHARAGGRRALGQPVARPRVPAGGVPRAVRAPLRARRAARALPRAQAARAPAARSSTRAGTRSTRGSASPSRSTTASRRRSPCATSRLRARRRSTRALDLARRPAPVSRRGALALVLHTHMPYVEGFGTWPFGEEWLWEAIATSLPAAARRARRRARPRDAVGHAGARRPARGAGRARALPRVPARDPPGVARARPRGARRRRSARRARALGRGATRRAADALDAPRRPARRACAPHATWTSAATHAVLPLLATDAGVRLQLATGIAAHRARSGDVGRRPLAARVRARAVARPAARGGGRARGLRRPHRRARPRRARARCAPPAGPLLVPLDRAALELVWSRDGYPSRGRLPRHARLTEHRHQAWASTARAYEPERARRAGAGRRRRVRRARRGARARRRAVRRARSTPSCSATTGTRAPQWLAAVLEEAERAGPARSRRSTTLLEADAGPAPRAAGRRRGATPRDLATWSGPGARGLAWRQRARRAARARRRPGVPTRALRELLALQSSDWAFLATQRHAPATTRVERAAGHAAAFAAALARRGAARSCAVSRPHLARAALFAAVTGRRDAFRPRGSYALRR